MQLGEVGGQGRVVDLAAAEPGVEPAERAGVGPPGVRADGGLDEAARGLCRGPIAASWGSILAGESFMVKVTPRPIIRARAGTCWSDTAGGLRILDPADGAVWS